MGAWMEDSDAGAFSNETLATQIQRVTVRTNKSHVLSFGDKSFESEPIGNIIESMGARKLPSVADDENSIDARDIEVHLAYEAWARAKTHEEKDAAWKWFMTIAAARAEDKMVLEGMVKQACSDVNLYGCVETFQNEEKDACSQTNCAQSLPRFTVARTRRRTGYRVRICQDL